MLGIALPNTFSSVSQVIRTSDILNNLGTNTLLDNIMDGKVTLGKAVSGLQILKNGNKVAIRGIAGISVGNIVLISGAMELLSSTNTYLQS